MEVKRCPICKVEFKTANKRKQYCSPKCSITGRSRKYIAKTKKTDRTNTNPNWTQEEDKYLRIRLNHVPMQSIIEHLKIRSRSAIRQHCTRLGLDWKPETELFFKYQPFLQSLNLELLEVVQSGRGKHRELKYKCKNGHIVMQLPGSILLGCAKCTSKYKMEELCRSIFEELFEKRFPKSKPKWLLGRELDGHNKELKLAFEYHGEQHFKKIAFFHQDGKTLEGQQRIDKEKRIKCEHQNITLIEIPYRVKPTQLVDYIKEELSNNAIQFTNKPIKIKELKHRLSELQQLREKLEEKDIELLTPFYMGSQQSIKLKHRSCGFTWKTRPTKIFHKKNKEGTKVGSGCPKCQRAGINAKHDQTEVKANIEAEGYSLPADWKYRNSHTPLLLTCPKNHFTDTLNYQNWQKGHRCRECAGQTLPTEKGLKELGTSKPYRFELQSTTRDVKKRYPWKCGRCQQIRWVTYQDMKRNPYNNGCAWCAGKKGTTIYNLKEFAERKKGMCLSTKYNNNNYRYWWECKRGHKWERAWKATKNGSWCDQCRFLDKLIKYAKSREGDMLSTQWRGWYEDYNWLCDKHGIWKAKAVITAQKSWCRQCANEKVSENWANQYGRKME